MILSEISKMAETNEISETSENNMVNETTEISELSGAINEMRRWSDMSEFRDTG